MCGILNLYNVRNAELYKGGVWVWRIGVMRLGCLSRPAMLVAMTSSTRYSLVRHMMRTASPLACEAAAPLSAAASLFSLLDSWLDRALQSEEKRRMALQKEAEQASTAEALGKWATLVVSNLHRIDPRAECVVVEDWEADGKQVELKIDPSKSAREQAEEAFKRARRLRRGSKVVAGALPLAQVLAQTIAILESIPNS